MTISPWLIYFADLADSLCNLLGGLVYLSSVIAVGGLITMMTACGMTDTITEEELRKKLGMKIFWRAAISGILFMFFCSFCPSTATVYKMIIIPTAVNSSVVQKLPDELQQFIDKELKVDDKT